MLEIKTRTRQILKLYLTNGDLHVTITVLYVDINRSYLNIFMLYVDKIYRACRGEKYATKITINHNRHFS